VRDFINGPNFMPFCWTLTGLGLIFAFGINYPQILQLIQAGKGLMCLG